MDQLLRDITTSRTQGSPSDGTTSKISFISPVSSKPTKKSDGDLLSVSSTRILTSAPPAPSAPQPATSTSSIQTFLTPLRSEPSYEVLVSTLTTILNASDTSLDPRRAPPTKSAPLCFTLLERILPHFWTVLHTDETKAGLDLLLTVFRTAVGISAIVSRLKILLNASNSGSAVTEDANKLLVGQVLDLLGSVLGDEDLVGNVRIQTQSLGGMQGNLLWTEFISLIAGGKVLSVAAAAREYMGMDDEDKNGRWVADGRKYSTWLGKAVAIAVQKVHTLDEETVKPFSQLLGRGLGLGYPDDLVKSLDSAIHIRAPNAPEHQSPTIVHTRYHALLSSLQSHEKRTFLFSWLRLKSAALATKCSFQPSSGPRKDKWWQNDLPDIQKVAVQLKRLLGVPDCKDLLIEWILQELPSAPTSNLSIRRAALLALSDDLESIRALFEKTLSTFSSALSIKHTPLLRQDAITQTLLLTASILHHTKPLILEKQARTSIYLNAISNRLAATSNRAKVLGMLVGESISGLVQKEGSKARLKFSLPDMETTEMSWWKDLIRIFDRPPTKEESMRLELESMQLTPTVAPTTPKVKVTKGFPSPTKPPPSKKPFKAPEKKGPVIMELLSDDESEEEDPDLVPYTKPADDAEDSDDDPTTVRRDKPSPPVYVRQLLTYLSKTDSYDHINLALTSAVGLIRAKAGFGTEVTAHSIDLYTAMLGLNDAFEISDFPRLRLQALIALVEADPRQVSPHAVKLFWEADYSVSQRLCILSSLVHGARLLAKLDDSKTTSIAPGKPEFASKMLPPHLHDLYTLDSLSRTQTRNLLAPLAKEAASSLAGPQALQVSQPKPKEKVLGQGTVTRTSRRLELQKSGKYAATSLNTLQQLASSCFLFPLLNTLHLYLTHALQTNTVGSVLGSPLLESYLKAISLILSAAGPNSTGVWDVLEELIRFLATVLVPRVSFKITPPPPEQKSSLFVLDASTRREKGLDENALIEPIASLALSVLKVVKEAGEISQRSFVERWGTLWSRGDEVVGLAGFSEVARRTYFGTGMVMGSVGMLRGEK
ncbi:hypothetical protein BJ508DRAFT_306666 [Ascobolus immersus RN42]|uniref:Telomere length regulation protein conserved domain-containing protein n=1 Tax=Ascobolus immersus RN42 TaxID=1160509 RepID=A0A3N4I5R4_ASCIM|nr:hypothetical protein BJ508DRAFT_306666 [Ascobolus immersus RN42]